MRIHFLILLVLVCSLEHAFSEGSQSAPLVITSSEVMTNSVRIAPKTMTNVHVNFKFEGKSPEEIMQLVGTNVLKPVVITGGDEKQTIGRVMGVLVEGNSPPVGIVVSFETREEAVQAIHSLRMRSKP